MDSVDHDQAAQNSVLEEWFLKTFGVKEKMLVTKFTKAKQKRMTFSKGFFFCRCAKSRDFVVNGEKKSCLTLRAPNKPKPKVPDIELNYEQCEFFLCPKFINSGEFRPFDAI